MSGRQALCRRLDKLEINEVKSSLDLFEQVAKKPDDEYLYALAFEKSETAKQLSEFRLSVCGERNVRESKKRS